MYFCLLQRTVRNYFKSVLHVQHAYLFGPFEQSNYWFLALSPWLEISSFELILTDGSSFSPFTSLLFFCLFVLLLLFCFGFIRQDVKESRNYSPCLIQSFWDATMRPCWRHCLHFVWFRCLSWLWWLAWAKYLPSKRNTFLVGKSA